MDHKQRLIAHRDTDIVVNISQKVVGDYIMQKHPMILTEPENV